MSSDDKIDVDELLDWLCWCWATDGERFYPPDETAEECAESLETDDVNVEYERGYHARAYIEAVDRFEDLEYHDFDPKKRAERHIEKAKERDQDLSKIDWSWWQDHKDSQGSEE